MSIHVVIRLLAESDFKIVSQLIFQFNFQQFHKEMDNKDCPNLFCVTFPCRRAVIRGFVSLQFYSSENLTHIHFQSKMPEGYILENRYKSAVSHHPETGQAKTYTQKSVVSLPGFEPGVKNHKCSMLLLAHPKRRQKIVGFRWQKLGIFPGRLLLQCFTLFWLYILWHK